MEKQHNHKNIAEFKKFWKKDGKAEKKAPDWAKTRASMTNAFPTYYDTAVDKFAMEVGHAITLLNDLKPKKDGPAYLGSTPGVPDYSDVNEAEINEFPTPLNEVMEESIALFDGMMNLNHPFCMPNVIPPANKAGIIAAMMTNVFSPNIIEGEYSWNVQKAEMESAAMMARIIGWNPKVAGGVYTYGGSGCYLYAIKYALTQVFGKQSRCTGIREDGKVLMSQQGHYAKMNATDWTGLGMNNIIDVETDDDTNVMDMEDLEKKMKFYQALGIPIVSIICTMGTTDAFAVDPVDKVRALIRKYPNKEPYGPTFIYCDAVIGWSWMMFREYNFNRNPLGFSKQVLPKIKANAEAMSLCKHADAIGIDFHKTGWATYNCSMFMMKDLNHFRRYMTRPGSAYLQERTPCNPGLYTLEVSRSGSYAMAGWATLKYFGTRGFQSVLGGILEMQCCLRNLIKLDKSMVCVNEDDNGFATLFRVYKADVDAEDQYEKEVSKKSHQKALIRNNNFQAQVADILWEWFRSGEKINGYYGPYTSYTSGFKCTDYNDNMSDGDAVIYALKSFPMNLNVTAQTMVDLIEMVKIARDKAASGYVANLPEHEVCPPYDQGNPEISCNNPDEPGRAIIKGLLSGVAGGRKKKIGRGLPE